MQVFNGGNVEGGQLVHVNNDTGVVGLVGLVVILVELGVKLRGPVALAVDNQAAIKIGQNRGVTARTKHFTDAIHYIRHMVDHRVIRVRYVRTEHQLADGFTKPLAKSQSRAWCSRLLGGVEDTYT